jgi:hypothetical protein
MAAVHSEVPIRAALVFQAVQLGQHLRQALSDAGINVVQESQANQLSASGFSDALDVFVVNLDPELEDHLDDISDLLDRYARPVIFNDGPASAGLAGWDQARWARHLASKIRGEIDAHPPRPKDAAFIPAPAKPAAAPKRAPIPAPVSAAVPAPAAAPAAARSPALPNTLEIPRPAVLASGDVQIADPGDLSIESLDDVGFALFDEKMPSTDALSVPSLAEQMPVAENVDALDAEFSWAADSTITESDSALADTNFDFDTSFFDAPDANAAPAQTLAPLQDVAPSAPAVADAMPASAPAELESLSWSLEPLDDEPLAPAPAPISGRAKYDAKDPTIAPVSMSIDLPQMPAAPPPMKDEALTDLSDIDFFADDFAAAADTPASAPAPATAPTQTHSGHKIAKNSEFDQLFADLDDMSFDATSPVVPESSAAARTSFDTDFDFDMDVEVPVADAHASAPLAAPSEPDFDSIFADQGSSIAAATPVASATSAQADGLQRVYVLGASIGGPEAVKSFLAKLKPNVPGALILAQHMGAEFLELMAAQLAKSSSIPVKLAVAGMPLKAAEVVVVPVNKRLVIDGAGLIVFEELQGESPYSPSIDQVMMDMSNRFGDRCVGIIFSGMASDAIDGSNYIVQRGGRVWVQDPATCVISSMIDGAQAAGVVSYVGAPEQLADRVLEDLGLR